MAICDNHKYKSSISVPEAKVTHKRGVWSDDVKKRLKDGEVFFDTSEKTGIWLGEQDLETGKVRVAHIAAAASEVEGIKEYVDNSVIKIGKRIDTLEKYIDTIDEKTDILQTNVTHLSEDVDHLRGDVDELRNRKVTHEMIEDGAVYGDNLKDGAIGTAKILDGSITMAKLSDEVISKLGSGGGISTDYSDKQTTDVDPSTVNPTGLYKFVDGNIYIVDDRDGAKTWKSLGGDGGGTWNPVS